MDQRYDDRSGAVAVGDVLGFIKFRRRVCVNLPRADYIVE